MTACVHHWQLDAVNAGRCRKCGAERQFERAEEWKQFGRHYRHTHEYVTRLREALREASEGEAL